MKDYFAGSQLFQG